MSSPLLVVVLPQLLLCCLLLLSQHATSTLRSAAASCPLLLLVASCLSDSCHVASHCSASTLHHLLLHRRLMYLSLTPHLHLCRLVAALYLIALPPPPVLLSRPLPLDALPPHGWCTASPHVAASNLPASLPLIAPLPLIVQLPPMPLVRLVVALPLLMPLPPICRQLCLSSCHCLLSYPCPCHCLLHL